MNKVFLIGDSTMCSFNDATYYYPRYGYGTQMFNYFNNLEFVNIALSGRSSKSYIKENNYSTFLNNIGEGDYLVLGFGHNDEKFDDPNRFSSALDDINKIGSFKYNLYKFYIKPALENNAKVILATPICRCDVDNNYQSNSGHITEFGDYRRCVLALGKELGIDVVDLTLETKNLYEKLGYNEAIKFHAWSTSNPMSVDTTHVNIYGAKMISYLFASYIKNNNLLLSSYLKDNLVEPTLVDLVVNPSYVERVYNCFNKTNYKELPQFKTDSEEWFGTAFGDVGCNPSNINESGFVASKFNDGFKVGQYLFSGMNKGKIASTEGAAYLFRQVSVGLNFKVSVKAKVIHTNNTKQQGFGLMLRDDIYINQEISDASINSNYVSAGVYSADSITNVVYSRENCKLNPLNVVEGLYKENDELLLSIERLGQVVYVSVIYNDNEFKATYTDFDFQAVDNKYMYVAMYATRGTVVEFTDVKFEVTGEAIKA